MQIAKLHYVVQYSNLYKKNEISLLLNALGITAAGYIIVRMIGSRLSFELIIIITLPL